VGVSYAATLPCDTRLLASVVAWFSYAATLPCDTRLLTSGAWFSYAATLPCERRQLTSGEWFIAGCRRCFWWLAGSLESVLVDHLTLAMLLHYRVIQDY